MVRQVKIFIIAKKQTQKQIQSNSVTTTLGDDHNMLVITVKKKTQQV
jgi:hypothetical protein